MRKGSRGSNPVALRLLLCNVGLVLDSCTVGFGVIPWMQRGLCLTGQTVDTQYHNIITHDRLELPPDVIDTIK